MPKNSVVSMAKRVLPNPKKVREEVEGVLDRPVLESAGGPMPLEERLRYGAKALEKLDKGREDFTPPEKLGLEAIVLLIARPALLVQDGDFGEPPTEWQHLGEKRDMLKGIIPSVGRVELQGHHSYEWCGTAFLVGDGILMTNKHVAQIFSEPQAKEWKFFSGVTAHVDYRQEHERDTAHELKVERVLAVHPTYDLALLAVEMKDAPKVLTLASKPPRALRDHEVAVVGYPAFDSRNGHTEQLDIFKNVFNVKRLQPGKTTGMKQSPQVLGHDCSTLGGNSGSAVVDLETGHVIALHFGGQYMVGNSAVPLWKLKEDVLLRKFGLSWDAPPPRRRVVRA